MGDQAYANVVNDLTRYVEWEAGGHAVEGAAISLCYFFILSLFLNFFSL